MGKNSFIIGNQKVGQNAPCYIIAEIGINHEGSLDECKKLIAAAHEAGVSAVKLQTVDPDECYVKGTESYKVFKSAFLNQDETGKAFEFARSLGVDIFTAVGDFNSIDWIDELDPSCYKISSGLLTNLPIIDYIAKKKRPMLFSRGMSPISEVEIAVNKAKENGVDEIGVFHCTSSYPTPIDMINLKVIDLLKEKNYINFDYKFGKNICWTNVYSMHIK